jgi:hypothetical protein
MSNQSVGIRDIAGMMQKAVLAAMMVSIRILATC